MESLLPEPRLSRLLLTRPPLLHRPRLRLPTDDLPSHSRSKLPPYIRHPPHLRHP